MVLLTPETSIPRNLSSPLFGWLWRRVDSACLLPRFRQHLEDTGSSPELPSKRTRGKACPSKGLEVFLGLLPGCAKALAFWKRPPSEYNRLDVTDTKTMERCEHGE